MKKLDISRELAERTDLPLADATRATDAVVEILKDAFNKGENVYIRGLGTFKIVKRKAKRVQDIRKHTSFIQPAHNTIKFIPSKLLTVKQ